MMNGQKTKRRISFYVIDLAVILTAYLCLIISIIVGENHDHRQICRWFFAHYSIIHSVIHTVANTGKPSIN